MLSTTFRALHDAEACTTSYRRLAKALGGIRAYGREKPISLLRILDICGLDDALWALWACSGSERFSRELACDCAEHVLHIFEEAHPNDKRPRECIETARRFVRDEATADELDAVEAAARAAAWDAVGHTARDAVGDAARAAWATAWAAAGHTAWAAAGHAQSAAGAAEMEWQGARLREKLKEPR